MAGSGLEEFEKIFGEARGGAAECMPTRRILFRVYASHLTTCVTDFQSNTWQAVQSLEQLHELGEDIGIGGAWPEFVDYLTSSFNSDDVKLVLREKPKSDVELFEVYKDLKDSIAKAEKSNSARTLESEPHKQRNYTVNDGNEKSVSFSNSGLEMSPEKAPTRKIVNNPVVPAYRRVKRQGAILQDSEEVEEN